MDIPWLAVFDGDEAGQRLRQAIADRGFDGVELEQRCRIHAAGDLEAQLVADGLGPELRDVLASLDIQDANDLSDDKLSDRLRDNKTAYAADFAARVRHDTHLARRAPEAFRTSIMQLRGLA